MRYNVVLRSQHVRTRKIGCKNTKFTVNLCHYTKVFRFEGK